MLLWPFQKTRKPHFLLFFMFNMVLYFFRNFYLYWYILALRTVCICLICGLFTRVYSCKMLTVFTSSTNTYRKPLWKHWTTFGVLWLSGANNATTVIRFHLTLNSRMLSAFPWKKIINEVENLFVLRIFLTFYRKCSIFSVGHRTVFMNSLWKVDVHGVFFFSF